MIPPIRRYLKQRGTAVITALLMVSIAAAIGVALMTEQKINIRRTQQLKTAQQAYYMSEGALYWAKAVIKDYVPLQQREAQQTGGLEWPQILPETPILGGQGRVRAELNIASNYINLNNLGSAEDVNKLTELLQGIDGMNQEQVQALIKAIKAWIEPKPTLQLDERYLAQTPPYRAAHQAMQSKSELRLVSGVTPQVYERLKDSVTAAPANGNQTFLLHAAVELQGQLLNVYSILQQTTAEGKVGVSVLWQSRGTW